MGVAGGMSGGYAFLLRCEDSVVVVGGMSGGYGMPFSCRVPRSRGQASRTPGKQTALPLPGTYQKASCVLASEALAKDFLIQ